MWRNGIQPMPPWRKPLVLVMAVWPTMILLGLWGGRPAIDVLLPLLDVVAEGLSEEFTARLTWDENDPDLLLIRAQLTRPLATTTAAGLKIGQVVTTGTNLAHVLVPPVIVFAVIASWPQPNLRRRLLGLILAVPLASIAVVLTTPLLLAARVETLVLDHAQAAGVVRDPSWLVHWMIWAEGGGRWLLALVLALACVGFVGRGGRGPNANTTPSAHP